MERLKNKNLRFKLTLYNSVILILCTLGLTVILNLSAFRMANIIDAEVVLPALEVNEDLNTEDSEAMVPIAFTSESQSARDYFKYSSYVYLIIIISLGAVGTYYITKKSLSPLSNLSDNMQDYSVHDLSKELAMPTNQDEVYHLTQSFNTMSRTLNGSFEMLKRFSSNVAHELRTPLAITKTKIDVFRKKEREPQEYDALIDTIYDNNLRLELIINNLLSLSNIESLELNETVNINDILKREAETLKQLKDIRFLYPDEDQYINGNKTLIEQVFKNLIENAIKFNVDHDNILVEMKATDQDITINVIDSNEQIPEDMLELIFEPLVKVDQSRNSKKSGFGLGLALVKRIVEKHNATITATHNNHGNTFTLVFLKKSK